MGVQPGRSKRRIKGPQTDESDGEIHVCHLLDGLQRGGAEKQVLDISRHTDERNVRYTVCHLGGGDALTREFEQHGIRVISFDSRIKPDPYAMLGLFRFLRRSDIDVLHTHLPYAQMCGRVLARVGGIEAVISTMHNVRENIPRHGLIGERATRPLDSVTVAVSRGVEHSYIESIHAYPEIGNGWSTIHNGIEVEVFNDRVEAADADALRAKWNLDENDPVFLNVGRYTPPKSQLDLIRAMEAVVEDLPRAQLLVVGHGELEGELRDEVSTRGLEGHIVVTGEVPSIAEYYALADAFVLSSKREGLPIVLLEAMAAELPVVATDIPGVREAVNDGETGLLVPPGAPNDLADAAVRMRSANVRSDFGRNGLQLASNRFSIDQTVSDYVSLYRRLVAETGRAQR